MHEVSSKWIVTPSVGPATDSIHGSVRSLLPDRSRTVTLSPLAFRLCWVLVIAFHLFNACFAFVCGAAHRVLAIPSVYQSTWMLAIPRETLLYASWCYFTVSIIHLFAAIQNVWQSVRQRKLAFRYDSARVRSLYVPCRLPSFVDNAVTVIKSLFRPIESVWDRYFGVRGFFGPQGRFFEAVFHGQLLVDIAAQTYQAHSISWTVPRLIVNQVVVGMIVLYCVKTPIIDYWLRKAPARRRLVNLIVDVMLDFCLGVVIPVWVLFPTLRDYDMQTGRFPQRLTYSDVWVANMMSEGRVALVTSTADCLASMVPHAMALVGIGSIKDILRCASSIVADASSIVIPLVPAEPKSLKMRLSVTTIAVDKLNQLPRFELRRMFSRLMGHRRTVTVINVMTLGFALLVVALHFESRMEHSAVVPSCTLRINAWLTTKYPCAIVQLNCYRLGTHGDSVILTNVLESLERSIVTRIVFSHCTALEVPPIVTEFPHLRAFEIYNSTITQWNSSAAITRFSTPRVVHILLIKSNIGTTDTSCYGCLPPGVLHRHLPVDLNLVVQYSNVTMHPENIGELWGNGNVRFITFWMDHTQLRSLPPSFSTLHLAKLSLMDNQLTELPDDLFAGTNKRLTMVRVSSNPLSKLPTTMTDSSKLVHMFADNTSVADLPVWLTDWWSPSSSGGRTHRHVASFRDSPVCCVVGNGSADQELCSNMSEMTLCHTVDPVTREDFRFDLVEAQRPL